jgi:hypothetical protein
MLLALSPPHTEDRRWPSVFASAGVRFVTEAVEFFQAQGLDPILIKGWAAARNYWELADRLYTDIDLAFSRAEYPRANQLLIERRHRGLSIDPHCELRHLDTAPWDDLYANSRLVDAEGVQIRILRPEDHLRVLAVHFLTDGAYFRDRLWDIYYAIDSNRQDFDWDRCLNVVSGRRRRWIICVIGLAQKYLNLELNNTPVANAAETLPTWFVDAVERQWQRETPLIDLRAVRSDPRRLFEQIKLRCPPEPIYAIVCMEGSIDSRFRFHYQIGAMFKRAAISARKSLGHAG